MGQQLLSTSGSRPGFLSRGFITAVLKLEGTVQVDRDKFMMLSIAGPTVGKSYLRTLVEDPAYR